MSSTDDELDKKRFWVCHPDEEDEFEHVIETDGMCTKHNAGGCSLFGKSLKPILKAYTEEEVVKGKIKQMLEMSNTDDELDKIREALKKDWRTLYVKEFKTDWAVQRLIRETEIDVMSLEAIQDLITEARVDELERFVNPIISGEADDAIVNRINKRLLELEEQSK